MKEWSPILQLAKSSLVWLAAAVVFGTAAAVGVDQYASALRIRLQQERAAEQSQQAQLQVKRDDLANVRSHIQRYEELKKQGLVGEPDRALWVEQLQATQTRLGLGTAIKYDLLAAKPLQASGDAADPGAPPALIHDLKFDLEGVHEVDLLNFLQAYRADVKGRFRVNSCKLSVPKDTGLSAQCVLRFLTIPAATPAPVATPG